jgi:hypothetical protein
VDKGVGRKSERLFIHFLKRKLWIGGQLSTECHIMSLENNELAWFSHIVYIEASNIWKGEKKMGATCEYCKGDMLKVKGCVFTHFEIKGEKVKRDVTDFGEIMPGRRCHDCGAINGQPHHFGCDTERCPVCGGQAIGCECLEGASLLRRK